MIPALVPPFALAWYAVWIIGRARYVHAAAAPVNTVAIVVGVLSPNGCASIVTWTPTCPPDTCRRA